MGADTFEKRGVRMLAQSDVCAVRQFSNETGGGTMTAYDVFPGVVLSFNDFHMERFERRGVADHSLFAIDHCREGRTEYTPGENVLACAEACGMKLNLCLQHAGMFVFTSHHYHGLSVAFDREVVRCSLSTEIRDFTVTPEEIIARWKLREHPRVLHGAEQMEHIFGELYRVPEKIRIPYLR